MQAPLLAVFTAMKVEAQALIGQLTRVEVSQPAGLSVFDGHLGETRILVVLSHIGKVAAALASQYVCDRFEPQYLLSAGLAGGLSSEAEPGTIVIGTAALQYDYDAQPIANGPAVLPHLTMSRIPAHEAFSSLLRRSSSQRATQTRGSGVLEGLVVSGDRIVRTTAERDRILSAHGDAICVDMESAAVAQVAYQNQVPHGILRFISDRADESFEASTIVQYAESSASKTIASVVTSALAGLTTAGNGMHSS